jgi:microcystin degradation protein MlrC
MSSQATGRRHPPRHGTLRIAYGRVAQESNALSPVTTQLEDFASCHLYEGEALASVASPAGHEVKGFLRDAECSGFVQAATADGDVQLLPLLSAWAVPSGPITRAALDSLRDRLIAALRAAGPIDGVLLSLHGAMTATDTFEPEAELLEAVRAVVGPDVIIGVSFDLHANLSSRKLAEIDVLGAYHTNPHRDHARTGARVGRILIDTLRGKVRPTTTWRSLPMVMGGGLTLDFLMPMLPIFWRITSLERKVPGVLLANIFMSHIWLDTPEVGWSVHVTTDGDQALADRVADELADGLWRVRYRLPPELPNAHAAIADARASWLRRKLGVVAFCDASDVVGAGAPGDRTQLLSAALGEGRDLQWLIPLRDPAAIAVLASARNGETVSLAVGATLDPARSTPVEVRGKLLRFDATEHFGRVAVLDLGHIKLVVTEGAAIAMKPEFYTDRGLDIWKADIVVVKSFFPFRIYFAKYLRRAIYVRTGDGTTDFDAWKQMQFAQPTWPAADPSDWRDNDRARRFGTARVAPEAQA